MTENAQICTEIDGSPLPHRGAANRGDIWKAGSTLRVSFIGGTPYMRKKIQAIAEEWMLYANIRFAFNVRGTAEVRCAFEKTGGCWSYVGTSGLHAPKREPTMNLGWISDLSSDTEYRRVVLHEFGHVLGLIHEHSSPAAKIPWNEDAVLSYYKRTQGWSAEKTRFNVLEPERVTDYTKFDPDSIMLYPVARELTRNGFEIPWVNSELSDTDKAFIATLYPFSFFKK